MSARGLIKRNSHDGTFVDRGQKRRVPKRGNATRQGEQWIATKKAKGNPTLMIEKKKKTFSSTSDLINASTTGGKMEATCTRGKAR